MRLYLQLTILLVLLLLVQLGGCSRSEEEKAAEFRALQTEAALLKRKRAYDEALAVYRKAIKLAPNHPASYAGRGETYLALDQVDQAQADFEHVLKLGENKTGQTVVPRDLAENLANSYYHLGAIAMAENKQDLALDHLEQALKTTRQPKNYFHLLKSSSAWDTVRHMSRFKALMEQYWPEQRTPVGVQPRPNYPRPPAPPGT